LSLLGHGSPAPADSPLPRTRSHLAMLLRTTDSPEKPASPRGQPVRDSRPNDARRLKRYLDALHAFTPARSNHTPDLGGLCVWSAHPFTRWPTVVRVSRGVSALGATMFFRARSHSHEPGCPGSVERDQRYVRSVSASQHSSTSTRILSPIPAHRHRLVVGRALCGVPPTETGDHRVSRRVDRFGGSYERHWGRVLPSQDRRGDRASDASVANPTRYRHTLLRGAR
jgi:hypothetical protein